MIIYQIPNKSLAIIWSYGLGDIYMKIYMLLLFVSCKVLLNALGRGVETLTFRSEEVNFLRVVPPCPKPLLYQVV